MTDRHTANTLSRLRELSAIDVQPADPLSADQVRTLGTRRRRRRTLAQGLGAAVALLVLVTGVATVNGAGPVHLLRPAGPPPTAIPAGFPIDRDPPSSAGDVQGPTTTAVANLSIVRLAPCLGVAAGTANSPVDWVYLNEDAKPVDGLVVAYTSPPLSEQVRLVQLFDDAATAERILQGVQDAVSRCPQRPAMPATGSTPASMATYTAERNGIGDDGIMVRSQVEQNGVPVASFGFRVQQIVRVGAAVLMVTEQHSETLDPEVQAASEARTKELAESLAHDLCDFSDDRC